MVKSQASLIVMLGIVAIGIFSLIYFLFSSAELKESLVESLKYLKLSAYLDYMKFFYRISLHFSTHLSVNEVAKRGGISQTGENYPRSWICNQVDVPTVEEVRFFLSNETIAFLNNYIKNFNQSEILRINLSEVSCIDFKVSSQEVKTGKNDENFEAVLIGSNILISLGDENVTSLGDLTERISFLRFWYMYRKFAEWTENYGPQYVLEMCKALSKICMCEGRGECRNCPEYFSEVKNVLSKSLRNLETTFSDPYVSCEYNVSCCVYEKKHCPNIIYEGCEEWREAPFCKDCVKLPYSKPCLGLQECSGSCAYYAEVKGAVKAVVSCKDTKYFVSTPNGPKELEFKVDITTYLKKIDCYTTKSCTYMPTDRGRKCIEISPGECYWVYPGYECECPLRVYCSKNCGGENIPPTIGERCECGSSIPPPQPPSPPGEQPPQPPSPPPPPQPPSPPP
ncbi:MAG: hypothetical protein QXG39_07075 [Candidatus Aenigmatarchaeota archaeon]